MIYPASKILTYSYDEVGNRTLLLGTGSDRTTYSYDSRGLLSHLLNPYSERTTWQYDAVGRPTTMTHANGTTAAQDYDAAGRLTTAFTTRQTAVSAASTWALPPSEMERPPYLRNGSWPSSAWSHGQLTGAGRPTAASGALVRCS